MDSAFNFVNQHIHRSSPIPGDIIQLNLTEETLFP